MAHLEAADSDGSDEVKKPQSRASILNKAEKDADPDEDTEMKNDEGDQEGEDEEDEEEYEIEAIIDAKRGKFKPVRSRLIYLSRLAS